MALAESCGVQDPKLDTFADVNRAATRFLLKNDAGYLKNSNATKARAVARKNAKDLARRAQDSK